MFGVYHDNILRRVACKRRGILTRNSRTARLEVLFEPSAPAVSQQTCSPLCPVHYRRSMKITGSGQSKDKKPFRDGFTTGNQEGRR